MVHYQIMQSPILIKASSKTSPIGSSFLQDIRRHKVVCFQVSHAILHGDDFGVRVSHIPTFTAIESVQGGHYISLEWTKEF